MEPDELATRLANGKRIVVLAWVAVFTVILVLLLDWQLKNQILAEGQQARKMLDELMAAGKAASNGQQRTPPARRSRTAAGTGGDAGDGLVHDAKAGKVLDQAPGDGPVPAPGVGTGTAGRPRGDG